MTKRADTKILSVVSGKGGVGKTTLSLSLAYELSLAGNNVLMLDFDFYNRGLSELATGYGYMKDEMCVLEEDFLLSHKQTVDSWSILELNKGIMFLDIPPLKSDILNSFESLSLFGIREQIRKIIKRASDATDADVVILDCHGSRDAVSYAAAAISDHIFVVCTPETATFFGTIRFVEEFKNLKETYDCAHRPTLHILLNNIMAGIRKNVLSGWYRKYFKKYSNDDDFLAFIPFDPKISIAASEELFPTKRFHYSAMAEKTKILLYDIFKDDSYIKTTKEARFAAKIMRPFISAQKPILSAIVDEKLPIQLLIASSLILFLGFYSFWRIVENDPQLREIQIAVYGAVVWYCSAFAISSWIIVAFIGRSIIVQDAIVSGEFGHRNWKDASKAAYRTACIILGTFLFIVFGIPNYSGDLDKFILMVPMPDFGNELFNKSMDFLRKQLFLSLKIIVVVATIIFHVFSAVFVVRGIRTILFRFLSGELVYRVIVLAGLSLAIYL